MERNLKGNRYPGVSRRQFLKQSSAIGAVAAVGFPNVTGAVAGSDEIRVGVIGCGGRGTGAALNVLQVPTEVIYPPPRNGYHTEDAVPGSQVGVKGIKVVALADLFRDRLEECRTQLRNVGNDVPDDRCFVGWDAYQALIDLDDVNYVILATPPYYRPKELHACVDAGKHVFMEKPVAVDSPGVRSIIESGEAAKKKSLGIAAGTLRRHQADIIETVRRLHEGAIGEIYQARAYFNIGEIWMIPREDGWSDMEWQQRNWPYYTWLSGDIIVEQHIHMIDMINWIMDANPVKAYGMGGRLARPGEEYGHIYDHFAIEYEYANGAMFFSQNRQIENCANRISAAVLGSKGRSNGENQISGLTEWQYEGKVRDAYEQEHINLIDSIRRGEPINEARQVAESTLTGIMGRDSCYSGDEITWEAALNSKRVFGPNELKFGPLELPEVPTPRNFEFE
ncbi:MAG: Gfo/Idh/MocA family oxidoreductase [Acidobacteriota bacterium]|nr:MAG: Gfo/Idh/MocA family oxidoreductase [Acidobacteriota bacterium]